jgi:hypothetical protein
MNPDGHESDTRLNINGYDLNRNFPLDAMPYDPPSPEPSDNDSATVKSWRETGAGAVQPEVAAVMEWSKQHNFVLSASLHQGALVANYPHDACDTQVRRRHQASCCTSNDQCFSYAGDVLWQRNLLWEDRSDAASMQQSAVCLRKADLTILLTSLLLQPRRFLRLWPTPCCQPVLLLASVHAQAVTCLLLLLLLLPGPGSLLPHSRGPAATLFSQRMCSR